MALRPGPFRPLERGSPAGAIRGKLMHHDILTFSDMCVDLVMSAGDVVPEFGQVEKLVDDYLLELGGSCNIFACQAAKLKLATTVLGRVGDDSFGELIVRRLRESGVDVSRVIVEPALKTGLGVALCTPGDRAILTYMGTIDAVHPRDVTDEVLMSARHLHHGSYFLHRNLRPAMSEVFSRARAMGVTTSLDTNWDPDDTWGDDLRSVLQHTDVFFPNVQEALRISRTSDIRDAAACFLELGVGVIAIKGGADGSWGCTAEQSFHQPVEPVTGGDTIGAGDSYDAGFLSGWLRGEPLERCLAIGTTCGRSVAARPGGLAGQPHLADLAH